MHIKIIALVSVTIISLIGGTAVALKIFYKPAIEPNAISTVIKANDTINTALVSYGSIVNLNWESNNAIRCYASGDWSGILPASGFQTTENIEAAKNYQIKCVNDKNESALSSVGVRIDENTIPPEARATITRDFFKDFAYNWGKNFCLNAKNDSDIIALQTVLFLEEFFDSADKITGDFNDETSTALKKFQEAYDIEQTGCAEQKTISKLNELYGFEIMAHSSLPSSSGSPSEPRLISGINFEVNELVRTTATINLRDEKCREIGIVSAGTLLKIISSEIKYCVIGGKKFQMRKIQVINTGQIGWLAAAYLERASGIASGGSKNGSGNTTTTAPAASSTVSVNLKANSSDGPSVSVPAGSTATLSWISTSTVSCMASGAWSGQKQTSGQELTEIINSRDYKLYTIQCRGNNNIFKSDSIAVLPSLSTSTSTSSTDIPAQEAPKIDSLQPGQSGIVEVIMGFLMIKIKGSGFAPHDNEVHAKWSDNNGNHDEIIKTLDSDSDARLELRLKVNIKIDPSKFTKMDLNIYIKNQNGKSNEKTIKLIRDFP